MTRWCEAALDDVDAFWSRTYEDLYGEPYEPIPGGFWPYGPEHRAAALRRTPRRPTTRSPATPSTAPPPTSSRGTTSTSSRACTTSSVASRIGIVFAHEFGHAIQTRGRAPQDATDGAASSRPTASPAPGRPTWRQGNSEHFELAVDDLDKAVAGFLALRDGVGHRVGRPGRPRHGLRPHRRLRGRATSRASSAAPSTRTTSATGDLVIVEVPFTDQADFEPRWQPPARRARAVAARRTSRTSGRCSSRRRDETWTPVADVVTFDPAVDEVECGDDTYCGDDLVNVSFYCVDDDTIYIDEVNLDPRAQPDRRLRRRHGDRPPVRLRRPGAPRDRREHLGEQPPRRLPRRRLRLAAASPATGRTRARRSSCPRATSTRP